MSDYTLRSMKFAILEILSDPSMKKQHKINILGRPNEEGFLEHHLSVRFESTDRFLADQAFEQLKTASLIQPTYGDLVDPEKWVKITDAGRQALELRVFDMLDSALQKINPHLLEIREGAWAAIASRQPDSLRQAAHSGRELIDQVLKDGAPDEKIRSQEGFLPDNSSRSGITRRHRFKFLMTKFQGATSSSDLHVVEKAYEFIMAVDRRLMAFSHAREVPSSTDVKDSLQAAEMALRRLLVNSE